MTNFILISYFNRTVLPFYSLISIPHFLTSFSLIALASNAQVNLAELLITIVIGFTARFLSMSANRLIDIKIDQKNPRTRNRPSATGEISQFQLLISLFLSIALYLSLAFYLSFSIFVFAFALLSLLIGYSYCKRFTIYRHFVLGGIYSLIPLSINLVLKISPTLITLLLAIVFASSIIARDLLYALQDLEFYKKEGLYSIPAKWGLQKTILLSITLHFMFLLSLSFIFHLLGSFRIFLFLLVPLFLTLTAQYYLIVKIGIEKSANSLFYIDIFNNISISLLAQFLYYSDLGLISF